MARKFALLLAGLLLTPGVALALGLGQIEASSGLNQPLEARIVLVGATPEELESLRVSLADPAQFDRAGIEYAGELSRLRFEVLTPASGADYIRVYSREALREPFLNFLIEVNWSRGRLVREYTVLLDPPLYEAARPAAVQPAKTAAAPTPAAPAAAPAPAAPAASLAPAATAAGVDSWTVSSGDTLWSIAGRFSGGSVSRQQMMIAILRANPEAFAGGNVNNMQRGAVLRIPEAARASETPASQALDLIKQQQAAWEDYRQGRAEATSPRPATTAAAPQAEEPAAPAGESGAAAGAAPPQGELKLVAPTEGPGAAGAAPSAAGGGLATELALANEQLVARQAENAELQARLKDAEALVAELQRAITVKDDELAALQGQLAAGGAPVAESSEAAAPVAETPTAETPTAETPAAETPAAEAPASQAQVAAGQEEPVAPGAPPSEPTPSPAAEPTPAGSPTAQAPEPAPEPQAAAPEQPVAETGVLGTAVALLTGFLPAGMVELVPGGPLTAAGVLVLVVLLLVGLLLRSAAARREESPAQSRAAATSAAAQAALASPPAAGAPSMTSEAALVERQQAARTERAPPSTADLPTVEGVDDPLAEVNVYLAYERFEQAAQLVREAIERHPEEPRYRLRLLEVFYSANNKRAFQEAARSLHEAVGGAGPLWENALAMWREIAPGEELLPTEQEAGEPAQPPAASLDEDLLSRTVAVPPPGGGAPMFGGARAGGAAIGAAAAGEELLDISGGGAESATSEFLDLTATSPGKSPVEFLDLTATSPGKSPASMLDLTATSTQGPESEVPDLLDISTAGAAEASAAPGGSGGPQAGLENTIDFELVSPLEQRQSPPSAEPAAQEGGLEFDLGGFEPASPEPQAGASAAEEMQAVEFDLGGFELAPESTAEQTLSPAELARAFEQERGEAAAAPGRGGLELGGLDLTPPEAGSEAGARRGATSSSPAVEFDLSGLEAEAGAAAGSGREAPVGAPDLDLTLSERERAPDAEFDIGSLSGPRGVPDLELEFDVTGARESAPATLDFSLDIPEAGQPATLSPSGPGGAAASGAEPATFAETIKLVRPGAGADGASLEELLREAEGKVGGSRENPSAGLPSLDIDFDLGLGSGTGQPSAPATERFQQTVPLTRAGETMPQSEIDEVDTQLNLAKAYVELGDNESAQELLREVLQRGTAEQRAQAQGLLGQLS